MNETDSTIFSDKEVAAITKGFFDPQTALPSNTVVAMAYVPIQLDTKAFDAETALNKGTLFSVLYKPFLGAGN